MRGPPPPHFPDPVALVAAWPLLGQPDALGLAPMRGGTNNTLYHVTSAAPGVAAHVLRLAASHHDERRARLEYTALVGLERQGLPFAVPTPILTADGEPWATLATAGGAALATLTRFIPGQPPERDNLAQAERAAEAIGALDVALAAVELSDAEAAVSWRSLGRLDKMTPLVPDPLAAFAALPIRTRRAGGCGTAIRR